MPKTHKPYPAEFKKKLIALVREGRTPESLSKQFEPSAQAIRNWVAQDERDESKRTDGLGTSERGELQRLRRQVGRLEEEREILRKTAAWFALETEKGSKGSSSS